MKCFLTVSVISCVILISLQIPQTRSKTITLDMAPNTFDDDYTNCEKDMEQIAPFLLQTEMAQHKLLRQSWEAATASLKNYQNLSLPPGFHTEHALAVMVYTNSSNPLYQEFNSAVREMGKSIKVYMEQFPFKALHFYLMRALQLLRAPESCKEDSGQVVYRGIRSIHFEPRKPGDSVRLSQFTSTSVEHKVAQKFSNATLFTLSTCFGASIKDLSIFPNEQEVLIPPNEVFQVSNFCQDGSRNLVTLRSLKQTCSNFNCAYLRSIKHNGLEGGRLEKEKSKKCMVKSGNINSMVLGKVTSCFLWEVNFCSSESAA
ncbi:ecto-ADP-ribosyltransferase 5-like isoform X2 [Macrotis lagotis]|uniref:ecto-ADP-ribosyltransferase 5-like isoform X2 n=1 Tax=Macrotis lagotis TaxID=92651 RepID=UPI003D682895